MKRRATQVMREFFNEMKNSVVTTLFDISRKGGDKKEKKKLKKHGSKTKGSLLSDINNKYA